MTEKIQLGRYAENPHQMGWMEKDFSYKGPTVLNEPLHGSPLGYNNILDANAALEVLLDFKGGPGVVVIKHKNPCGLATGETLKQAFENAWLGDEVSAFGSIVGYSQKVTEDVVKLLMGKFVEVLVAPSYDKAALEWIQSKKAKKNLRVIQTGQLDNPGFIEAHEIRGGRISQEQDDTLYLCDTIDGLFGDPVELKEPNSGIEYRVGTVSDRKFEIGMQGLVEFSIMAGKHTKSNAIISAYEYEEGQYRVLGMGAGQPNRLDSAQKLSLPKARENLMRQYFREKGLNYEMTMDKMIQDGTYREDLIGEVNSYIASVLSSEKVVAFSDAFFPKRDGLDAIARMGVKYVICPGGSKADEEVIQATNEHGIAMVFTGIRHFRH